ncbi:MAG: hypothetical protein HOV81_30230 [Kofleriaceae bacterium]|nr:hypothetical protein [Kofleriaceae bacterium]
MLTDDPANCGACGHDCGGAACYAGVCLPETMARVPNYASYDLEIEGDDLVFATRGDVTSSGAVYRVAKTGGLASVVYRGFAADPSLAIAADGSIIVADSSQARRCDLEESAGTIVSLDAAAPSLVSMGRRCVASLTDTASGVAWIEEASWIGALSTGRSPDEAPSVLRDRMADHYPQNLVRVGDTLLWSENGTIMQMTAGTATPVVSGLGLGAEILAFAADSDDIAYAWRSPYAAAHLIVRSRASSAEHVLAKDTHDFGSPIALDRDFVYVNMDGGLWAFARTSGERQQLATGWFPAIAHDDRYVYALRETVRTGAPQTEAVRMLKPAIPAQPFTAPFGCAAPLTTCVGELEEETCLDLRSDPAHCGACDTACAPAETCAAGECVCAASSLVCNGSCVDPATDGANCGACGRTCGGGACIGGDCMPVELANRASTAVHDTAAVYYAATSQIRRLDKQSYADALVSQLAAPFNYARYLAHDATKIYIAADTGLLGPTNPGGIYSVAKAGGAAPTALYADRPDPRHVAIANDAVVWSEDASDSPLALNNRLVYAAASGSGIRGSFQPTALYAGAGDDETRGIAVAGTSVYWALGDSTNHGAVVRVDLAATTPTPSVLVALDFAPSALAVVGDNLYVTGGGQDGKLISVPLAGGPITVHATGLYHPGSVAAAPGGGVLWIDGARYRSIHDRPAGAALARIVMSGDDVNAWTVLLVDEDRLFTASNGIHVLRR